MKLSVSYPSSSPILVTSEKGKFGDFVEWEELDGSTGETGRNSTCYCPWDKRFERAVNAGWRNNCNYVTELLALEGVSWPQGMQCKPIRLVKTGFQKKTTTLLYLTFRIMSRSRENEFWCFLSLIHFVGRYLRDLHVESSIFCTAVSCSGAQFLAGVNW